MPLCGWERQQRRGYGRHRNEAQVRQGALGWASSEGTRRAAAGASWELEDPAVEAGREVGR